MSTAFAIDHLMEREEETALLELMLSLYPEAPIYTLAHIPKNIRGPVAHHKVHSTFLSRLIKEKKDFKRFHFLVPSACKSFKFDPSIKTLISFSSGFIQGLEVPAPIKHICYVSQIKNFPSSFFAPYLNKWQKKTWEKKITFIAATESLKKQLQKEISVVPPVIETAELSFCEDYKPEYYLVNGNVENKDFLQKIIKTLETTGKPVQILDTQGCLGDRAFFLQKAFAFIDFSHDLFPRYSLEALCMGIPVMALRSIGHQEFLPQDSLINSTEDLLNVPPVTEERRREYRRLALHFNGRIFKGRVQGVLRSLY